MSSPKILLLDIETAPAIAYIWRLFDENIGIDQIIQPSRVICWGAKWLGKREMFYADERAGKLEMFMGIHKLLSEADAVITYNGDKFDLPKLDGSFVEYDLDPVPPPTSIDLLKTVRKLGVQSNRLAFIAPHLKIGNKVKHEGFTLWSSCLNGDAAAWERMKRYNAQDVRLLGGLYDVLRPYIKNHPYLGIPERKLASLWRSAPMGPQHQPDVHSECPRCGSPHTQSRGVRRTKSFIIQRKQCFRCGGWHDGKREKVT